MFIDCCCRFCLLLSYFLFLVNPFIFITQVWLGRLLGPGVRAVTFTGLVHLLTPIPGLQFLVVACGALFIGVQLMFEYREEMRHGIFRKY